RIDGGAETSATPGGQVLLSHPRVLSRCERCVRGQRLAVVVRVHRAAGPMSPAPVPPTAELLSEPSSHRSCLAGRGRKISNAQEPRIRIVPPCAPKGQGPCRRSWCNLGDMLN